MLPEGSTLVVEEAGVPAHGCRRPGLVPEDEQVDVEEDEEEETVGCGATGRLLLLLLELLELLEQLDVVDVD